jgi:Ni,Fe-hydrogenase III large subunit
MQTTSQALAQLDLLHRTITLHTVFGATRHDRERLLQIANELTGVRTETLTTALGQIDIKIEKLHGGQIK